MENINALNYRRDYRYRVEHYTGDAMYGGFTFFKTMVESVFYQKTMLQAGYSVVIIYRILPDGSVISAT